MFYAVWPLCKTLTCFNLKHVLACFTVKHLPFGQAFSPSSERMTKGSDEGLTLETSAFQSLYGGQFTLSTLLINQIFVLGKTVPEVLDTLGTQDGGHSFISQYGPT